MLTPDEKIAVQLIQMREHVITALTTFPGGGVIDGTSSLAHIEASLRPGVAGLPDHEDALDAAIATLKAIRGFAESTPEDSNHASASAVSALLIFRKKEQVRCPVVLH